MQDHVASVVGQGEVMLGEGGLARVKGSLITKGIRTMANRGGHVDHRAENSRRIRIRIQIYDQIV